MDFTLSESQRELAALTRRILTDKVTPERLAEVEGAGDRFDPALWADLAAAGVLAAALPEELGGAGLGLLDQCSVLAEMGRAVAPAPYLASIVLGAGALARFGTPDQRKRWAEPAGRGELILTAALSDEDGTPAVSAERAPGGWRLSGTKTTVPAGARADLTLLPALTAHGTLVFLIERSDSPITRQPQRLSDGDIAARLELDGAEIPDERVLGGPGAGPGIAGWLASRGTVGLCALQLGIAERALELTSEYAKSRVQFGKPIGSFQAVAQRLADAFIDVEAIRLTLWQAAWRLEAGLPAETEVATAKFWAADAGHRIAHTAVHVHGGVGIDTEYPVHRYFVAAKRAEFELGGATAQLRRIGTALAQEASGEEGAHDSGVVVAPVARH
jgi:3-oxocholest-4-en-26-oyl-CoA dehydrogenase beta subunit